MTYAVSRRCSAAELSVRSAGDGIRTRMSFRPVDFKSTAYTNSSHTGNED